MATPDLVSTSYTLGEKTGDTTFYMGHGLPGEWKLVGITLVPTQAITADGSNKFVLTASDGSTTVGTYDTSSTALVAGTGAAFTMSAAGTALEFGSTDSVKVECDETGSATLDAVFYCLWQKARV